jgi:catechol 2,3-dioxygenase-like lactoylglutathione lyase family enzyme
MTDLRSAEAVAIVCVRDRAKATVFYRDVLGLRFEADDGFAAVFSVGAIRLRVSTVEDWTAHAHTVLGFRVDDVAGTVRGLVEKGVTIERYPSFPHDEMGIITLPTGVKVAWFKDPEGNVLSVSNV